MIGSSRARASLASASTLALVALIASGATTSGCATLFPPPPSMQKTPTAAAVDDSKPLWLPFVADRPKGMPVIEVRVNGETVRAVVDTGATTSAITSDALKRLKLGRSELTEKVRGADGTAVQLSLYRVTVSVGERYEELLVSAMTGAFGIEMLLGRDFLDSVEIVMPASNDRVGMFAPGRGPRTGLVQVPVDKKPDGLFVALVGKSPSKKMLLVDALVDTGASMSRVRAFDIGDEKVDARGTRAVRGVTGGFTTLGVLELTDVRVQPVQLGTVVVNVDDTKDAPALLGMDVIKRFDVVIATAKRELWLGPPGALPQS